MKAHEKDTIYIFGHAREGLGVSGTAADLTAMRDYFSAVLDHVQKGIAAGQSRDAIVALTALPKFEDYPIFTSHRACRRARCRVRRIDAEMILGTCA